ncbi:MAG: TerC family protein [Phycisphaerales bacterium]|nr:TerC family protein [Phycisphaerales bacterium]MCB9863605.1 TerC family protein [Phycisphaerales bacterium]
MSDILTTANLIALLTLTLLEIVLGIDNIVFISILTGRLPEDQQQRARTIGLILAMGMRIVLLMAISWIVTLESALFTLFEHGFSGRDLIMLVGGLFLIAKATYEIHHNIEGPDEKDVEMKKAVASMGAALMQIVVIDIVFSLDSVITAVGMADSIYIMIAAVVISVGIMLAAAGPIGNFVNRHPTMKMLALAFLILIGVMLVADGLGQHVSKGYIYFAMAFSLSVELLNMWARKNRNKAAS